MTDRERCIRPFVPTAAKNAKYHSSPPREGRSTVESAIENEGRHEEVTGDISKKGI